LFPKCSVNRLKISALPPNISGEQARAKKKANDSELLWSGGYTFTGQGVRFSPEYAADFLDF